MKCKECEKCKFVSKNVARKMRSEFMRILSKLARVLKQKGYGGFSAMIVGSAKRNMIIQRGNEFFDTDIQALYGKKGLKLGIEFKKTFYNELDKLISKYENEYEYKLHLSTSVITVQMLKNSKNYHSFDIAIIRSHANKSELNRGKVNDETSTDNFSWGFIKDVNSAYRTFRELKGRTKTQYINDIKQRYINKKCKNRRNNKDNIKYKTSSQLFVESVHEIIKP